MSTVKVFYLNQDLDRIVKIFFLSWNMDITKERLIAYAIQHDGEYHAIKKAIDSNKQPSVHPPVRALTILDDGYPTELKDLPQPPWVLFYDGDITLLHQRKMAIIGSRDPNAYGIMQTQCLVDAIPKDVVIVSGLAKGIDRAAHERAILAHRSIGVLGCGIMRVYPYEHRDLYAHLRKKHLIISEYPFDAIPFPHRFIARNRIIAALCDPIFVMSASLKSGSMITVDHALSLNKDIVALPYRCNEKIGSGCNQLIASGAHILTNPKDLFIIDK